MQKLKEISSKLWTLAQTRWESLAPGKDLLRSLEVLGGGLGVLALWVGLTAPAAPSSEVVLSLTSVHGEAPDTLAAMAHSENAHGEAAHDSHGHTEHGEEKHDDAGHGDGEHGDTAHKTAHDTHGSQDAGHGADDHKDDHHDTDGHDSDHNSHGKKDQHAPLTLAKLPEHGHRTDTAPSHAQPSHAPSHGTAPKINSSGALSPVPDLGLIAESPYGFLPIVGVDGRRPFEAYARPFQDSYKRKRIAIVIRGIGLSAKVSEDAIASLPANITMAISPYARDAQRWVSRARAHGHEVLLDLPMEPFGFPAEDPGPHVLLTGLPIPELLGRLHRQLARATGYVGVVNTAGGAFLASQKDLRPVFKDLADRGLYFLEDSSDEQGQWQGIARQTGLGAFSAQRVIDVNPSRRRIDLALLEVEARALSAGKAAGIGHALPVTIQQILAWLPTLESKGLVLAPVSAMMAPTTTAKRETSHAGNAAHH